MVRTRLILWVDGPLNLTLTHTARRNEAIFQERDHLRNELEELRKEYCRVTASPVGSPFRCGLSSI